MTTENDSNQTIILDGIRMKLQAPDLDGDGIVGGVESVTQQMSNSETQVTIPAEMAETMKELNSDKLDPTTRMSSIDLKSVLSPFEIAPLLAVDTLVSMGVMPRSCLVLSRQKKRLNVSQNGVGRDQMVKVTQGMREHEAKTAAAGGAMDKTKNFAGL